MKTNNLLNTAYKIATFALPLSASGMLNTISSFISMMMVTQLGKKQLAASALAISTFIAVLTIIGTIFYAIGILVSHGRSQEKTQMEIGLIIKSGFCLAVLLAFAAAVGLWHIDKLLFLLGQDPQLVMLTHDYFHFAALNMFPLLLMTVIGQFYSGIGKPGFTLLIAVIALPLLILASYGFVLGHFGLPKLGLSGITCASLFIQSLMVFVTLIVMSKMTNLKPYQLFHKPLLPTWAICQSIFSLGIPIGIQFGGEIVAMTMFTYLMGYFGMTALASSQIVSQYFMLVLMLTLGLTQALSLLISEAYGKQEMRLISQYLSTSMLILFSYSIIISIFFIIFPKQLIIFYVGKNVIVDVSLLSLTTIFFGISSVTLFFDGIRHLLSGALRGLHETQVPMRISIIAMWLLSLPTSYLAGFIYHGGPIGLRLGFLSGFIFSAMMLWVYMCKKLPNLS